MVVMSVLAPYEVKRFVKRTRLSKVEPSPSQIALNWSGSSNMLDGLSPECRLIFEEQVRAKLKLSIDVRNSVAWVYRQNLDGFL
jgi:hypothetical protein